MNTLVFDIGGTFLKYALLSEDCRILEKKETPTEAQKGGQALIQKVIDIAKGYGDFSRIGVSTAGQVDSQTGTVLFATDTLSNYTGTRVKALLENELQVPVAVENDVNAAALGEYAFGAAKGKRDFICLTYGTGIGGAVFLDGRLYKGSGCSAGELGHIVTHVGGRRCTCGGKGCYEQYAAASALTKEVSRILGNETDGRGVFLAENFSRPAVKLAVSNWIDEVVAGLRTVVYTFNPSLILLGGGIMREKRITDEVCSRLLPGLMPTFRKLRISPCALGNDAALFGAAYLAGQIEGKE